jgi:protein phosphatase
MMAELSVPIAVAFGAATDPGLRRRINEDSYLAQAPLFLVADGMGGHNAGEIASATVVEVFQQLAGRESVSQAEVHEALVVARRRVAALPPGGGAGAGTTLAGVVVADVDGDGYWLAMNLGDSRTYRLSDGIFEQVSVDHSFVQELVDAGELDAAQAHTDSRRNVITRAIGAGSDADADYWLIPAEEGDRILVCSDGLSGELEQDAIHGILLAETDPQAAATRLVHEAMVRGGRDNITALVVDALAVRSRNARSADRDTVPVGAPTVAVEADFDIDADTLPRAAFTGGS